MFNSNGSRISSIVTTRQYRRIGPSCIYVHTVVNLHTLGNDSLMMTVIGVVNVVANKNEDNNTFEFRTGESPQTLWPGNNNKMHGVTCIVYHSNSRWSTI